jgi:hypothetical protein
VNEDAAIFTGQINQEVDRLFYKVKSKNADKHGSAMFRRRAQSGENAEADKNIA